MCQIWKLWIYLLPKLQLNALAVQCHYWFKVKILQPNIYGFHQLPAFIFGAFIPIDHQVWFLPPNIWTPHTFYCSLHHPPLGHSFLFANTIGKTWIYLFKFGGNLPTDSMPVYVMLSNCESGWLGPDNVELCSYWSMDNWYWSLQFGGGPIVHPKQAASLEQLLIESFCSVSCNWANKNYARDNAICWQSH